MKELIVTAVRRMSVLKYFPPDSYAREEIMRLLEQIVETPDRLSWLVNTLLTHAEEWPSLPQIRALYARRWKPKDGIEGPRCTIPGSTPADSETAYLFSAAPLKLIEASALDPTAFVRTAEELASIAEFQARMKLQARAMAAKPMSLKPLMAKTADSDEYRDWLRRHEAASKKFKAKPDESPDNE